jgi:hypothetical protein
MTRLFFLDQDETGKCLIMNKVESIKILTPSKRTVEQSKIKLLHLVSPAFTKHIIDCDYSHFTYFPTTNSQQGPVIQKGLA